jgi:hypothetical protein
MERNEEKTELLTLYVSFLTRYNGWRNPYIEQSCFVYSTSAVLNMRVVVGPHYRGILPNSDAPVVGIAPSVGVGVFSAGARVVKATLLRWDALA